MQQCQLGGFAHLHKLSFSNVLIFHLSITFTHVQLNALPICTVSHMGCERRLSVCPVPISMLKRPHSVHTNSSVQEHIAKKLPQILLRYCPRYCQKYCHRYCQDITRYIKCVPGSAFQWLQCTQCCYAHSTVQFNKILPKILPR